MIPLVEARGIGFATRRTTILDDISLVLPPGRITVVLGPNGAGKSTLLRLLVGELAPTSGSIAYSGVPLRDLPHWQLAAKRAVLPQSGSLAFPFTVYEVVALGLDGAGSPVAGRSAQARIATALEQADVAHLAERQFPTLSGGEQQRVQFARVLCQLAAGRIHEPRQVLFLDEPVSGLDLEHQIAVLETARRLATEGAAVFAILHDLNLAAAYADELIVLKSGRQVAHGTPADVLTDRLLAETFGVRLAIRAIPAAPMPFVLPQARQSAP
ncbi:heme ABC transporter ATP-binding protein [Chelatococcus asaccharovorans]|uniref:heme ABC transporter ATP-binding protein n=1 Tax=Chelatococcus asaccharovorans TaxID=28210 RepID=UPI00224C7A70|nr:heme ABC transporter ATP-binding protein [Chelatococcus asaccharovorans]CAH1672425.1 Hemin import ATP-binding protein HmuV [Chelatococcus asaccharovorans]CAH1676171.1 Hemin import ATP-binding protein HmuV [Chelatococcus asaccharovorans]